MKICFLLQRNFAYVGQKLAIELKEKYGVKEFCAYVQLRSSYEFLKKQTEVNYTSLILDEDIHNSFKDEKLDLKYLKNLEREYGLPSIWPMLAVDRLLMFSMLVREYPYNSPMYTHEEMMRLVQVHAKAIIKFLDAEKPSAVIITVVGSIGSMLLYHIAKKKNIPVLLIMETRIKDDYTLTNTYKGLSWADEVFDNLQKNNKLSLKINEAKNYLKSFRDQPLANLNFWAKDDITKKKSRFREYRWFLPKNFFRSLNWYFKYTLDFFSRKKYLDYDEGEPLDYFYDHLKRKVRTLIGFNDLYDKIDFNEDYAFFPLHYEPEIATLLLAPNWTDQINLIKQIAQSLPLHFKLYVKEHPSMVGYRTRAYYRELKKIPNVKLINPDIISIEIIKNAKLLTTITGTAGWEATLLKKPVITFGDIFYNKLSFVKKCENIETLPLLIKNQLENFNYNEAELENFIGALMEISAPISLIEIWDIGVEKEKEKQALGLLSDLIIKKLNR